MKRRDWLKVSGAAIAGAYVDGMIRPLKVRAAGKVNPRATARLCIFTELPGAISHVDCWDVKETKWTPKDLDIRKVTSDLYLSKTLFPRYDDWAAKASFVRSMRAPELIHFTGEYHTQTGRALNAAVAKEIPGFGSVIAAELDGQRRESDTFPGYVSLNLVKNRVGSIGSGFFPARFSGVDLDPSSVLEVFGGNGTSDSLMQQRWDVLQKLILVSPAERASIGERATDYKAFYAAGHQILNDPRWIRVFQMSDEDKKEYTSDFGISCALARNLIAADAGTRFVYISDDAGWDHHSNIFDRSKPSNHYVKCLSFDRAFSKLVKDLSSLPGKESGKTLLDETLVVVTSEFGRLPFMNVAAGRDHHNLCYTSLYMGGGVKPGRIIGKTNEDGGKCIDVGWKHKEQPAMDNTVATIYSALGFDWSKTVENTPSGRAYHYVQNAPIGASDFISNDAIDELFA